MPRPFQTLTHHTHFCHEEKRSRFIAHLWPIKSNEEGFKYFEVIKREHPDARHHCWAYVIGDPEQALAAGFNDDGEPGGTAGKPMLNVLMQRKVGNVFAVVVRYFGGTLLGVPGLINAYKSAASMALQVTPVVQKPIEVVYTLQFDYTQMNEIMMHVKQMNCQVLEKDMNLFCRLVIGIPKGRLDEALYKFKDIRNVEILKNSL